MFGYTVLDAWPVNAANAGAMMASTTMIRMTIIEATAILSRRSRRQVRES